MTAPGWEGILDEGEEILWQGRPAPGIDWRAMLNAHVFVGLFVAGFGVFWTIMAVSMMAGAGSGPPLLFRLVFPLFGEVFVFTAMRNVMKKPLDAYRRQKGTFYTLSNKAAYVATDIGGKRSLDRYLLADMDRLRLVDGAPGSVMFGTTSDQGRVPGSGEPGFLRLSDARDVFGRVRDARDRVGSAG